MMSNVPASSPGSAPFIMGRLVYLHPYGEKDAQAFVEWVNDPECRHYARNMFPQSLESEKKWVAEQGEYSQKVKVMGFSIWLCEERRIIGSVGLFGLDYSNGNCWMGLEIGDKSCWGKGYATDAGALILDYTFGELGIHKIIVGIYSPNKGSQAVARKLGFKLVGTSKEEVFVDGHYVDGFVYELLSDEWKGFGGRRSG